MPFSWDAFLTRYGPLGRALASGLARPSAVPEDLVQEASLALFAALRRDPERFRSPEHARNYFLRAVRNLALKTHRGAERESPLEVEPPARDAHDPAATAVLARQRALARLLLELDPAGRELIARRFLRRETYAQIAAQTGIPISTLHTREKALLANLKKRLEALEREEAG